MSLQCFSSEMIIENIKWLSSKLSPLGYAEQILLWLKQAPERPSLKIFSTLNLTCNYDHEKKIRKLSSKKAATWETFIMF